MQRHRERVVRLVWVVVGLGFAGCPASPEPGPKSRPSPPEGSPADALADRATSERGAVRLAELHPTIHEVGPPAGAPEKVVVEFSSPVVQAAGVAPGATELRIEPPVGGKLHFEGPSTLAFVPSEGFAPSTRYTVRLIRVDSMHGVLDSDGLREHVFETPAFEWVRADLASVDLAKRRVEIDLVYSGAVRAGTLRGKVRVQRAGRNPLSIRIRQGDAPHIARLTVSGAGLAPGVQLRVQQDAPVPHAFTSVSAGPASRALRIPQGEAVRILATKLEEGTGGFFLRVVCTDDARDSGRRRHFWDPALQQGFRVSRRCVLDEDSARERVHFNPRIPFSVSPTRGGFRLLGPFERRSYALRIEAGARSVDGGVLKMPYRVSFSVPARKPRISFNAQGRYLSRRAFKSIALRHMNVSAAVLEVRHVRPDNLVFWLAQGEERATERTSDLVLRKEIALSTKPDALETTWYDVASWVSDLPRGVLSLEVRDKKGGATARAPILMTDLNLVAKQEAKTAETLAFALDLHTQAPVAGVEVRQVVRSGRVLSRCVTDGTGECRLAGVGKDAVDQAPPFALIATRGTDLTYLKYAELETPLDEVSSEGRPFSTDAPYRAAIYSDRGVYRPGETARVVAIVRGRDDRAPEAGLPVTWELCDPRRKVVRRRVLETNEAGLMSLDLPFADFADTGRYEVRLSAGEKAVARYGLNVEEFVPERMRITARPVSKDLVPSDPAHFEVEVRYLFGGSAEGSRAEIRCELVAAPFVPPTNRDYVYGVWRASPPGPVALGRAHGVVRADNTVRLSCPALDGRGAFVGAARVRAQVAVFESGSGRSTQTSATSFVHPARRYLGLKAPGGNLQAGKVVPVQGIIVDWTGARVREDGEVELLLYRVEHEYDWTYDEATGRWRNQHFRRLVEEGRWTEKMADGRFETSVTPGTDASAFVLRARQGRARVDLELPGDGEPHGYWTRREQDRTPKPAKPADLRLEVPKTVEVGNPIRVRFTPPFAGRALVSLETDRVIEHAWVDVKAEPTTWTTSVPSFVPNVYVSVLAVKDPHLESKEAFVPSRAFGLASMRVRPKAFGMPVNIALPAEVRAHSELEVKLSLGPGPAGRYVTVAAVDEGVLQLTRFATPDPLAQIFDRRRLGIRTFETVGWNLLLPAAGRAKRPGGDAGSATPGRVQPIKPVALWSGVKVVPPDGELAVRFEVPQYRGALRVMAVAAGPVRLGSASGTVLVRDPLVLQSTLPRFLADRDTVEVPVFLTNLSGKARDIEVRVGVDALALDGVREPSGGQRRPSPVVLTGPSTQRMRLPNGRSGTAVFTLRAERSVGAARVRVEARSGSLISREVLELPLLPAAPRTRTVHKVGLSSGTVDLLPFLDGWLPTTETTKFWVTANPYGAVFDHLRHLIRYPYGCVEQTTSSTRPLLFVRRFLPHVDPELVEPERIQEMVMTGIRRILSMQTPEGGFAYWPGGREPVAWGTAYALHLLLDARELRYDVPPDRIDEALGWVERSLDTRAMPGGVTVEPNTQAYLHLVLARSGRGRKAAASRLLETLTARAGSRDVAEARFMAQAALYLAGDRRHETALRTLDVSAVDRARLNDWSFFSDRRRRGFMLATYVDLFGRSDEAEPLAQRVADALAGGRSADYTTQELAWGITGLGKYLEPGRGSGGSVTLRGQGRGVPQVGAPDRPGKKKRGPVTDWTWAIYRASEYERLELDVDAEEGRPLYLVVSSEGVRKNAAFVTGGNGLRVQRRWRSAGGEPFDFRSHRIPLGEVVYVELSIENTSGERVRNVALVDRLPAAFEIENPRLARSSHVSWVDDRRAWAVEHMNLRDDRIALFGTIERNARHTFVYAVRAVSAGRFTVPPAQVEAMYDPTRWARTSGAKVVVAGPWGE